MDLKLELLSESVKNEIDELQSLLENSDDVLLKAKRISFQKQLRNIVKNLESVNNSIYVAFEESSLNDIEELQENYNVLHDVLHEKLSFEEKVDMRLKYNIDFHY